MIQSLSGLRGVLFSGGHRTETFAFYLHYRLTFLLLLFCCALITTRQFVGNKIQCVASPSNEISVTFLENYCWAASTYSVSSDFFKEVGVVPHPGISGSEDSSEYTYRNYYQYVYLVLFIQSLLFYTPHLIWKSVGSNRMTGLYTMIDSCKTSEAKEDYAKENAAIKRPFFHSAAVYIDDRWGTHNENAVRYILCELLALINLMVQSCLLDVFLHGEFFGLGLFYWTHYAADRMTDPIRLFPLVTNCYFKRFGAGGGIDVVDALCVLPVNVLNVKIFLFLWVWLAVLLVVTIADLASLLVSCFVPKYRTVWPNLKKTLRHSKRSDDGTHVNLLETCRFGDWFVLSGVRSNMEELDFARLMASVSDLRKEVKLP